MLEVDWIDFCQPGVWLSPGIGFGQTWQNMVGSSLGCSGARAPGVVCVNQTQKPIFVNIQINCPGGGVSLFVNAVLTQYGYCSSDADASLSTIVPPGSSYYMVGGTASTLTWAELR